MKTVIFICQGNMVRSQYAEALYRKYKSGDVLSAGILPKREQNDGKRLEDLGIPMHIQAMHDKEGIDISKNICKVVNEKMLNEAEKVVVMADETLWPDFLKNEMI